MKYTILSLDDVAPEPSYQAPRTATGVEWSRRLTTEEYPLWLCVSQLHDRAVLRWDDQHADDGVYVVAGGLSADGRTIPTGGALIVEADVATQAEAIGPTTVVHVGSSMPAGPVPGPLGRPDRDGHAVHAVGPAGWFTSGRQEGVRATWFADGTCPTCRIQLFTVEGPPRHGGRGTGHSHSQSEVIYVLAGSLQLGAYELGPGSAQSIPADAHYAIRGGADGHLFLNYRADVSEQKYDRNDGPLLETALSRGGSVVADLR